MKTDSNIAVYKKAFKPFDVVTNNKGDVGIVQEVNVNDEEEQLLYSIHWLVGTETKNAWFTHEELTRHGNLFIAISEMVRHPFGSCSKQTIKKLFSNF